MPHFPSKLRSGLLVGLMLAVSCGYGRKDTAKVVDPTLVGQGTAYERQGTLGGFTLGPYAIRKTKLERRPANLGPMGPSDVSRPGEEISLTAEVSIPTRGRTWVATCVGRRKPTLEDEYAAVLDEAREAVEITCELSSGQGATWKFEAQGLLSGNFGGTVTPERTTESASSLDVEILLYRRRFDTVKRHLNEPVAQVKSGRQAIAAMILSRPELAWVAPGAPAELEEVSMTVLAALDLIPLGFEG
jgi:hypothetical protein